MAATVQWNLSSETLAKRPPVLMEGTHIPGIRSYKNLSLKTTCLERPYFYGQMGQSLQTGAAVLATKA